jgi:predicted TIM-barrel fold metal-dependent hydrolase
MIIDGHQHIAGEPGPILARMDALGIGQTVLVGVGVRDLSAVTVRDSVVFRVPFLLRTLGVRRSRATVRVLRERGLLLPRPDNTRVAAALRAHPDRFRGFVFVNPADPDMLTEVERCRAAGFCGIKLALLQYPAALDGPEISSLCELAGKRRVPIFFHQGLTAATADASGMVRRFPRVRFIVAHAGVQYFEQAVALARSCVNVWLDTSSYFVTPAKLKRLWRDPGPGKLVFGSDVPVMARDAGEALAKIKALPASAAERAAVLGGHLLRILEAN